MKKKRKSIFNKNKVPHKILCKRTSNQTSPVRQAEMSFPPLSAVLPEVSPVMRAPA